MEGIFKVKYLMLISIDNYINNNKNNKIYWLSKKYKVNK